MSAVLFDLSRRSGCISHDLLIAKLAAYCFDTALYCLYFLTLKIASNTFLVSGVPQCSILGPTPLISK